MTQGSPDEQTPASSGGEVAPSAAGAQPKTSSFYVRRESERIGLALRGELRCVVCKYDLQGLSVRGVCPECGTAVRATILMMVDPKAEALAPMNAPRLVAFGLGLCSAAGLGAALLCWMPRVADLLTRVGVAIPRSVSAPFWLGPAIVLLAALSGLGALALVRPVRGAPWWPTLTAVIGVLAYAPICWGMWEIHGRIDRMKAWAYLIGAPNPDRIFWRTVVAIGLMVALACVRPNARRLVHRSLALRTGRVDRQTLLAMVGAVGLSSLGDAVRYCSLLIPARYGSMVDDLGTIAVAFGSLLFTLGAGSALVDSLRIGRAILTPMPSLRKVIG